MQEQQLVVFLLGSERYAFPIRSVREIIPYQEMIPIPGAAFYMEGIIDLRGKIIPVMDTRKRMGMAPTEIGPTTRIMVLEAGESPTGCVVDEVAAVVRITEEAVVPVPDFHKDQSDYLDGVVRAGAELVLLLNPHRVLSRELMAEG